MFCQLLDAHYFEVEQEGTAEPTAEQVIGNRATGRIRSFNCHQESFVRRNVQYDRRPF
jgi:hypothetical protein